MPGETIRDVVIRVAIESATPQLAPPDTSAAKQAIDEVNREQQESIQETAKALSESLVQQGETDPFASLDELRKGIKQAQQDNADLLDTYTEMKQEADEGTAALADYFKRLYQGSAETEEAIGAILGSLEGLDEATKGALLADYASQLDVRVNRSLDKTRTLLVGAALGAIQFARGLALLTGEQAPEQLIKTLAQFQALIDLGKGGFEVFDKLDKGIKFATVSLEGMATKQMLAAAATAAQSSAATAGTAANASLSLSYNGVTMAANRATLATLRLTGAMLTNPAFLAFAAVIGTITAVLAMMKLPEDDFAADSESMRQRLQEIETQAAATRRALDIRAAGLFGGDSEVKEITSSIAEMEDATEQARLSMEKLQRSKAQTEGVTSIGGPNVTQVDITSERSIELADLLLSRNEARVEVAKDELQLRYDLLAASERVHHEQVRGIQAQIEAVEAQQRAVDLAERQVLAQERSVEQARKQLEIAEARITSEDAALGRLTDGEFARLEFIKKRIEAGKELSQQELEFLERTGLASAREIVERQQAARGAERGGGADFFGADVAPKTAASLEESLDEATKGVHDAQRAEADAKQRLAEAQDNLAIGLSLVGTTEELTKKLEDLNQAWTQQRADQVSAIQATTETVKAMSDDLKEAKQEMERLREEHRRFALNN